MLYSEFRERGFYHYLKQGCRVLALLSTLLILVLTYYFFSNYNVYYVFAHSSTSTPWVYKISSVWVGQEGTFLLWAWITLLSASILIEKSGEFSRRTGLVVLALGIFLLGMAYAMDPFKTTMSEMKAYAEENNIPLDSILGYYQSAGMYSPEGGFIDGNGLSPFLMSPWMALHPPIVFIAYATLAVPFGAAFVHLLQAGGDWERTSRNWSRFSWLFLTVGIVIGGFWAYGELSYGGYWVWDPVETASLIPWVSLTGLLHASTLYRKSKKFSILSPALALFTFIFIFYATFITRSGILKSVHGYASTSVGPFLGGFMILATIASFALIARAFMTRERMPSVEGRPLISTTNVYYLTASLLILLTLVLLSGITYPVLMKVLKGTEIPVEKEFFNKWSFPFVNSLMLTMGFCLLLGLVKKGLLLRITGGVIVLTLVLLALKPGPSMYLDSSLFFLAFALIGVFYKIVIEIRRAGTKAALLRRVNPNIIHLGMILLLAGVIYSMVFQSSTTLAYIYPQEIGAGKSIGDYRVEFSGLDLYEDDGNWVQLARLKIYKNGKPVGESNVRFINDRKYGPYPKVGILRGLEDVYVVFHGFQTGVVPFTVRIIPGVSILWIGTILLTLGMLLQLILDLKTK